MIWSARIAHAIECCPWWLQALLAIQLGGCGDTPARGWLQEAASHSVAPSRMMTRALEEEEEEAAEAAEALRKPQQAQEHHAGEAKAGAA